LGDGNKKGNTITQYIYALWFICLLILEFRLEILVSSSNVQYYYSVYVRARVRLTVFN
jgi:hypothetical protein